MTWAISIRLSPRNIVSLGLDAGHFVKKKNNLISKSVNKL